MSNEIHIGIIEERKQLHPDRCDRPPDVSEWLVRMDHELKNIPVGLDSIAAYTAERFAEFFVAWPGTVDEATRNQLTYRALLEILRLLRSEEELDDRQIVNMLPDHMVTFILDVATGKCEEPKSAGRSEFTYIIRDTLINYSVHFIHDKMKLPYESDEHYSACHEVADYFGMKYGKVRTIWRKVRDRKRSTDVQNPELEQWIRKLKILDTLKPIEL